MKRFSVLFILAISLGAAIETEHAVAQEVFPSRTVKFVVPSAAGSATDTVARVLANRLSKNWGHSVVVENIAGAGLNLGAAHVARSTPDGYTLLVAPPPPVTVNHLLYSNLSYQPAQFVPVTMLAQTPNVLIVRNQIPATTVQEFIAHAKSVPGKLSYGSQGLGATAHLTARLFESRTGVQMTHVPYRREVPVLNDIVAGHIDVFFGTLSTANSLYRTHKLKILGVGSLERNGAIPEVPTIAESGLPGFRSTAWYALVAPPGTQAVLVQTINRDALAAMRDDQVSRSLRDVLLKSAAGSPQEAVAFIAGETEQWTKVISDAGIPLQ